MAKIDRKYLAHFINAGEGEEALYVRLGEDLEEYSPELSAQVDTKKNILGQSSVLISTYEKTGSVEPYYAQAGDPLFEKLQTILDQGLVLDQLKTDVVEVKLWKSEDGTSYPAIREEAYIEVVSYGGDTTGYQIPFKLHFTGNKVKGSFNVASKTFTEE